MSRASGGASNTMPAQAATDSWKPTVRTRNGSTRTNNATASARRAASGQLSVFGSEPGESDYNPLWEEFFVQWKAGSQPVLLVRDDQIKGLSKQGKLTLRDAHIVLNAPITKVG